ncbi:sialidase family protein [Tuwongella immobilis]|uniref:Exo-alpha-sialidase n=1 Tax=Tuwongella immobilis TaxID=692036 RepID=A0A6C2YQD7_9BACT|nr:sialidase family protein [Tuwongella immobilis]VIP03567.1 Uncharacterized protein OS=Isosphaera pallida (strain ATCC 43644 / DSM 9630 / IS1B) GN=Isop_3614 PE=4 SV=1: BNR_2 [Tuwongella immobilis]VTS04502.1 Uncharacterized protein OS=Isosphaera pallida (strain ATCC 43644 / DSM 9630 / IS1B) GN=Isop_3614 PE=4 SV=1: BNR_2 [Tuwongella immobilis]
MSRIVLLLAGAIGILPSGIIVAKEPTLKLVSVNKIWDAAPHNAFTDLIRDSDRWYCVFREGKGHVSPDGALRVITSADGKSWESAALIRSPNSDLRDAKITRTPTGEWMLSGAEAFHDRSKHSHQSLVWFSKDGKTWSEKHAIGDIDFWLWRTTWHRKVAYSVGYGCGRERLVRLYASKDGKAFEPIVPRLFDKGYPNESALLFDSDTAYCLLRRDGNPSSGLWGISQAPFTEWKWLDMGVKIGGPQMIRLPNGKILAAVRLYDRKVRTALAWIDPTTGKLTEALALPSGGDTSYAGMVWHDNQIWVSYYSSHEGKTNIYLAVVAVE